MMQTHELLGTEVSIAETKFTRKEGIAGRCGMFIERRGPNCIVTVDGSNYALMSHELQATGRDVFETLVGVVADQALRSLRRNAHKAGREGITPEVADEEFEEELGEFNAALDGHGDALAEAGDLVVTIMFKLVAGEHFDDR